MITNLTKNFKPVSFKIGKLDGYSNLPDLFSHRCSPFPQRMKFVNLSIFFYLFYPNKFESCESFGVCQFCSQRSVLPFEISQNSKKYYVSTKIKLSKPQGTYTATTCTKFQMFKTNPPKPKKSIQSPSNCMW